MKKHPLTQFFESKGWSVNDGMQWLQGEATERFGALISDNGGPSGVVNPEDVAPCHVDHILRLAKAWQFIPEHRRAAEDSAALCGTFAQSQ